MFTCIVFLLFLSLLNATKANFNDPPSSYIFLALGVSKAAYGPIPRRLWHNRFIKDSDGRAVCDGNVWNEEGTGVLHDSELILFTNPVTKFAVFGFRGTEVTNPSDWRRNLQTKLIPIHKQYKLHQGFARHFNNIRAWFDERYRRLSSENYRIVLTGHSLGGALATIAASHATRVLHRRPFAVITFASPKVGDFAFSSYYKSNVGCDRTLRIVVQNDVITKLPFQTSGYYHVCGALTIRDNNGLLDLVKHHSINDGYDKALSIKYRGRRMKNVRYLCKKP